MKTQVTLTEREAGLLLIMKFGWHIARHYSEKEYLVLEKYGLCRGVGYRSEITEEGKRLAGTILITRKVEVSL